MRCREPLEIRGVVGEDQPSAKAYRGAHDERISGQFAPGPDRSEEVTGDARDAHACREDLRVAAYFQSCLVTDAAGRPFGVW